MTIDTKRLRELAEKATPDGQYGSYTLDGTTRLREFQHFAHPQTVIALLDEIDRLDEAFDRDLPWRYAEVEAQRNQLAAVMESAVATGDRAWGTGNFDWYDLRDILATPATAPTDALREVKAAAWDEGVNAEARAAVTASPRIKNPYREEQS